MRLYLLADGGRTARVFGEGFAPAPLPPEEAGRLAGVLAVCPPDRPILETGEGTVIFRGGRISTAGYEGEFLIELERGDDRTLSLALVDVMRQIVLKLGEVQANALAGHYEFLLASASNIISNLALDAVLQEIVDGATKLLSSERGSLMLIDANGELRIRAAQGMPLDVMASVRIRLGDGISGGVAKTGEPVLIRDIENDPRFAKKSGSQYNTTSLLSVPLNFRGRVIGVFNVNNKRNGEVYDERDLRMLMALGSLAAAAIENARQYEELLDKQAQLDAQIEAYSNLYEEQNTLYEIIRVFRGSYDKPDESRDRMVEMAIDTIGARVGILVRVEDDKFKVAFARGFKRDEFTPTKLHGEEHLIARLINEKGSVILNGIGGAFAAEPAKVTADEIREDPFFEDVNHLVDGGLRNAIVVPLYDFDKKQKLGAIVIANRIDGEDFTEHNRNLLAILGGQIEAAISQNRLLEQFIVKKNMEKELDVAKEIQTKLLPKQRPDFERINVWALNLAAKAVSGDYYDFLDHGDSFGKLGIIIGDVAGKGIPAALIMAMTRAILRTQVRDNSSPAVILQRSNEFLNEDIESNRYVTMIYAILDQATFELTFSKAGHNPPLWYKAKEGTIEFLETEGFPLGMFDFSEYADTVIQLAPGDKIVFYTDGITEAMNEHQEEYSLERLCQLLKDHADFDSRSLIERIMDDVGIFCGDTPPHDDLTIIVLSIDPFRYEWEELVSSRQAIVDFTERFIERIRAAGILEETEGREKIDEFEMQMLLDELLINAAEHGNKFNPEKRVRVGTAITSYKIEVVAEDEGRGFDWREMLREKEKISLLHKRGRGIQIMKRLFDVVEYNDAGNRCRVVKYLR